MKIIDAIALLRTIADYGGDWSGDWEHQVRESLGPLLDIAEAALAVAQFDGPVECAPFDDLDIAFVNLATSLRQ